MKTKLYLLSLLSMICSFGFSQVDVDLQLQAAESVIQSNLTSVQPVYEPGDIYTIPVVVHVLHKGEYLDNTPTYVEQPYSTNISYEQITSAINNLTDRFRNTWAPYWENEDTNGNLPRISTDAGIEFRLANRDPNGNPTNGILRHDYSSNATYVEKGLVTTGVDTNIETILSATGWPRENYLNIWVVSEINDNDGGCGSVTLSSFPQTQLDAQDGVIVQWNRFGYGAFANTNMAMNSDLTEAVGTYLGLYQTWRNTPTCEAANAESDCSSQGDMVCDTPPTPRNCSAMCSSRCSAPNGEPSMQTYDTVLDVYPDTYNYMDDTGQQCKRRFTQGQVDRMRTTLQTLRSNLGNYIWVQEPVHNLSATISIERVGYNKYQPTVIFENSGDFTESTWSLTVSVDEDQTISHTIDSELLGSIDARSTWNVTFPVIQLVDFSTFNITVSVTNANDAYAQDNSDTYTLVKTQDSYLKIESQYNGTAAYACVMLYDVDNDKLLVDGRKYYGSSFNSIRRKALEGYKFIGYGEDLYGNVFPNYIMFSSSSTDGIHTGARNIVDHYYIPPGNYIMQFSSNQTWLNGPYAGQHAVLSSRSCQNGCYLSVGYNEEEPLYYVSDASEDYDSDPIFGGIYLPAEVDFDNPIEYPFTVPTNFVSTEASCLPENINGLCDASVQSVSLPEFTTYNEALGATHASLVTEIISQGYKQIDSVRFVLSTDETFSAIVKDTTVRSVVVAEEYFPRKPKTELVVSDLQELTTYWFKSYVDGVESDVVQFTTFENACESNSVTYNGVEYRVVAIGNRCWFAENLRTDRLRGGASLQNCNPDAFEDFVTKWGQVGDSQTPAFAHAEGELDNSVKGNIYNGWAVQTGELCPTGWRVMSHYDLYYLDSLIGPGVEAKIYPTPDDPLANAYRMTGTDNYGLRLGSVTGGSVSYGNDWFGGSSYWTKNQWPESVIGAQPEDFIPKADILTFNAISKFNKFPLFNYGGIQSSNTTFETAISQNATQSVLSRGHVVRCVTGGVIPEEINGNLQITKGVQVLDDFGNATNITRYERTCNFTPWATVHTEDPLITDECGVCGGKGIPDGYCDCQGNVEDAIGICGGSCDEDLNGDGICDVALRAFVDGCTSPEIDGKTYSVIAIGNQCWFTENLNTSVYANGDAIGEVQDSEAWSSTTNGAWCYYDNDANNETDKAKLYNWYAVTDTRGVCPTGWHVPTDEDWKQLETLASVPRAELNSNGYRGISTGSGALIGPSSTLGFSGDFGGIRVDNDGSFREINNAGYYWTTDDYFSFKPRYANSAWHRGIFANVDAIGRYHDTWQTSGTKGHGMSVRCILD